MTSGQMRLITAEQVSPSEGLSVDEALANQAPNRTMHEPWTLKLYTYKDHALLTGRYQRIEAEVDLSTLRSNPTIGINRRPTGGGTILMGSGQLGVALTHHANSNWSPREGIKDFGSAIAYALSNLGIDARLRGKNDLEVGGKKICGLGIYKDASGGVLNHASILFDLDYELLLSVLAVPDIKLAAHRSKTVSSRVTTVSAELGRTVNPLEYIKVIADALALYFGAKISKGHLSDEEHSLAQDLQREKYETDDWIFLSTANKHLRHTSVQVRSHVGTLEVNLELQGPTIQSAIITGDFNVYTWELALIETYLKWQPLDPKRLRVRLHEIEHSVAHIVDIEHLLQALCTAQVHSEISSPIRIGSCYVPEEYHIAK